MPTPRPVNEPLNRPLSKSGTMTYLQLDYSRTEDKVDKIIHNFIKIVAP